jgi:hypothetical protein
MWGSMSVALAARADLGKCIDPEKWVATASPTLRTVSKKIPQMTIRARWRSGVPRLADRGRAGIAGEGPQGGMGSLLSAEVLLIGLCARQLAPIAGYRPEIPSVPAKKRSASADRLLRHSIVDLNLNVDLRQSGVLRSISFPHRIACQHHRADPWLNVCRHSVAYHRRPLGFS